MSHLTMIYLDIYTWLAILAFSAAELKEYCLREKLEAKCGTNEVIVMQSARYGRLRLGHCVQKDFGFIGCAVDVLTITERICSGHQQCTIDVFKTFGNLRPCSELEAFLEADYACIPVIEVSARHCIPSGAEPITTDLGYISSLSTTRASHLGQRSCTLTLWAKPGQRWNISLVDFSVPGHLVSGHISSGQLPPAESEAAAVNDGDAVMDDRLPVCQRYAVIRDERLSTGSVICGGGSAREKLVHLSTSHVIQVDVFGRGADPAAQYLFRIEAIGCPDLEAPNVVVVWKDADRMQLRCNSTGQLHQMTCVDKRWTGDNVGISCDKEASRSIWQIIQQDWTSKPAYGILLMTLLGVILGIIIGCSMLAISVLCHRRKIKSQSAQSSAIEIHKTLLMRKSVDMMSSSSRNASQSAADTSSSAEYAARALWRETTAPRGGARLDEYFIPHKYSLRTTVATEADNGQDPFAGDRQASDPGVTGIDGSGEDGCRYHACLQRAAAVVATGGPETEIGAGRSYSACADAAAAAAAAANPMQQPMYSESSGYGNSTVSLSTMEHIYEIPE